MSQPATINPRIIDALYCQALVLSDEVRSAFDMSGRLDRICDAGSRHEDAARLALSCEALRTTTRMMHAIAWLLNHRAYFAGELSDFQLRRHGRLAPDFPTADPERMAFIEPEVRKLIEATEHFYARLVRVDAGWRDGAPARTGEVATLHARLAGAVG